MSVNLFKESSAATRELGKELRGILGELDPAVAQPLLDRLSVDSHSTPLLVFTGQYSSGKSTLIKALTDGAASVVIGSGVTTDAVEEFDWEGDVRLVDTPGVHAGRPHHDDLAEKALQKADLVLFAVTVELFDDVLTDRLRDVLGRLGKSQQTLIVVTKAGTMEADEGVRDKAIKEALGPFEQIPWVECDGQYYLDGLDLAASDPTASNAFIEASGLGSVATLINRFASQQGELGKLSQPLQLIGALAFEASADLTDDPNEQAALTVLARQRSALSKKRIHLDNLLEARAAQFRAHAVRAATQFADSIERDEQSGAEGALDEAADGHMTALNDDLRAALDRFEDEVRQVLEVQFDDLASEVLEIEASPYGRTSVRLGDREASGFEARHVEVRPGGSPLPPPASWAGDLSKYLKQFHEFWGAGSGTKAAAGSTGHKVVLTVGKAFGKKFKPWEAVRTANKIGKVAKVGGVAISIGLEAYGVVAEERSAVKEEQARAERRRSIIHEVLAQADGIVVAALRAVGSNLKDTFGPEFRRIDAMADEIDGARATRSGLLDRLISVRQRAETALAALSISHGTLSAGSAAGLSPPIVG
ncbi:MULTISPECIES: GTPase [unclassified Arthrobacter]|uniref:GTPase n=1 Tax=unclassified Arthrobacter TaxID=235627 RepID=UPI002DFBFD5B|nr:MULTISPECIES: GTPase [unclassified Arthrobacter]MEC5193202.1 tRNA U34 5-carboxymethylaminomethyl modifying GTPase MnmE/TrmE [Arthrobacter sp. MP_M4]MEC5204631.1 tRNA U34 5-carboxymethylaminomethyl modifying GTPase MnmE/TrmE [Arthrobacter sp. MP_M7]